MTDVVSAGILLFRRAPDGPQFLLVHPGGPFWKNKDTAGWSIPKGLVEADEDPWDAALREFAEETGAAIPGPGVALAPCRTPGRKLIRAWLVEGDFDPATLVSDTFEIEWPPRSGRRATFPEVDRAAWFTAAEAATKIHVGQRPLLDEAIALLAAPSP